MIILFGSSINKLYLTLIDDQDNEKYNHLRENLDFQICECMLFLSS